MSQPQTPTRQELDVQVEKLMLHIGKVLKIRRKAARYTLQDIHKLLGMDGANLSHFETAKTPSYLTLRNFLRLKLFYDIAWQQLLPLPPSTAERLITHILHMSPKAQESLLYLLEYGVGDLPPVDDPPVLSSCLVTSSSA